MFIRTKMLSQAVAGVAVAVASTLALAPAQAQGDRQDRPDLCAMTGGAGVDGKSRSHRSACRRRHCRRQADQADLTVSCAWAGAKASVEATATATLPTACDNILVRMNMKFSLIGLEPRSRPFSPP